MEQTYIRGLREHGWRIEHLILWDKQSNINTSERRYMNSVETVFNVVGKFQLGLTKCGYDTLISMYVRSGIKNQTGVFECVP